MRFWMMELNAGVHAGLDVGKTVIHRVTTSKCDFQLTMSSIDVQNNEPLFGLISLLFSQFI